MWETSHSILQTNGSQFKYTGIVQAVKAKCMVNFGARMGVINSVRWGRGVRQDFIKEVHLWAASWQMKRHLLCGRGRRLFLWLGWEHLKAWETCKGFWTLRRVVGKAEKGPDDQATTVMPYSRNREVRTWCSCHFTGRFQTPMSCVTLQHI